MTDLDALARRIAQRIVLIAHGATYVPDAAIETALGALREAHAAGAAEMRETCAALSDTRYADRAWEPLCRSAGRSIADAIRELPLPTTGEIP